MPARLVSAQGVRPSAYNPRKADADRLDLVALSLRKLGFVLPLYADTRGELLSGHQRHAIAVERLGLDQVPVDVVAPASLGHRMALNLAFNRGTNDMGRTDSCRSLTEEVGLADPWALADALADRDPSDETAFYRCLHPRMVPVRQLLDANPGRRSKYAFNLARSLYRYGVVMPLVSDPDGRIINGLGRLECYARKRMERVPVVVLEAEEVPFAQVMLNGLTMDFDIHEGYRDLLRYNSFRRIRHVRETLGRGFTFALVGAKAARTVDLRQPVWASRWRQRYGTRICDFGAGHLHEAAMLEAIGVEVTAFEPYRVSRHDTVDKAASLALTRCFLEAVGAGRTFSTVFCSSVLNSVPFAQDRSHIACLLAALAEGAEVHVTCLSTDTNVWQAVHRGDRAAETGGSRLSFALDYEPGVMVGDLSARPKVQKHHTVAELRALFTPFFRDVKAGRWDGDNVNLIAKDPFPVDVDRLRQAVAFEFDLPYPDGTRMGMVAPALGAFGRRHRVTL